MDTISFDKLLLKTAFCCMACDGDIDSTEVEFLKNFYTNKVEDSTNLLNDINELLNSLNEKGKSFLMSFINELKTANLSEEEELEIIDISLKMVYADNIVKYSEMKFFKLVRFSLKISNELILMTFPKKTNFLNTNDPDIIDSLPEIYQFLEEDIVTESYIEKITNQYLETAELPKFELISSFDSGK